MARVEAVKVTMNPYSLGSFVRVPADGCLAQAVLKVLRVSVKA
jgi:hypothetical protein